MSTAKLEMLMNEIDEQADKLLDMILDNEAEVRRQKRIVKMALSKIIELEQVNKQLYQRHEALNREYFRLCDKVKHIKYSNISITSASL